MRLVHFSTVPLGDLKSVADQAKARTYKPHGFWLSDEDAEQSWSKWCTDDDYGLGAVTTTFDLVAGHNVLILSTASDLRDFTADFSRGTERYHADVDWQGVADKYQGMLITPYQWTLRLDSTVNWYYPWDCASACVWDVAALRRVTP